MPAALRHLGAGMADRGGLLCWVSHHTKTMSKLIRIEQPTSISCRGWFFARGTAGGFGATYGVTLSKKTVASRLKRKAGHGKLVKIKKSWYWETSK
jgi:hypothetical protein